MGVFCSSLMSRFPGRLLRLLLLLLLLLNRNSRPLSAGEHSIIIITFMSSIYNNILEINHISRVYSAAAVLHLPFVLCVMIFHILSMFCTFQSMCAVPNMDLFCSYLISQYVAEVLSE